MMKNNLIDVIVIGGGHAGIEAAAAAARLGCQTVLITQNKQRIGELSCNPAIGGVGKGQLVKEVDALGGVMGRLADQACIQFRRLNQSRGAAVRSSRMQVDMDVYRQAAQSSLSAIPNLTVREDEVVDVQVVNGELKAVVTKGQGRLATKTAVLAVGTFFNGLIHIGDKQIPGGRIGDPPSNQLPQALQKLGLKFGRFKTGTTPRLNGETINFSQLIEQAGDQQFMPFSSSSPQQPQLKQVSCYIGHTNPATHQLIREHLDQSALYSGQITGTGVRYCPSVEDKIVKFPERESHHVFVEPEGLGTTRFYPNGLSNSLPAAIQKKMVHSVSGLTQAEIVQDGYGIEHDYLQPTQLQRTLETKDIKGLFFAGQINGTTGYEEAAAQGIMAGINAVLQVKQQPAFVLQRSQAYIGVLIDDLITKGTNEPYRMFTSRVEYRLVIREDNADERLTKLGYQLGLVPEACYQQCCQKMAAIEEEMQRLASVKCSPTPEVNQLLIRDAQPIDQTVSLLTLLKRSELTYDHLLKLDPDTANIPEEIQQAVEIRVKYEGYIKRQQAEINKNSDLEYYRIPPSFQYQGISGLSLEVIEKLSTIRPDTLGHAARISGITPAAISLLMLHLKKK